MAGLPSPSAVSKSRASRSSAGPLARVLLLKTMLGMVCRARSACHQQQAVPNPSARMAEKSGAGEGARTLDPDLGKVKPCICPVLRPS
jgi:hypothetical protein